MSRHQERFRLYLMRYDPPDLDMHALGNEGVERMMKTCDACFTKMGAGEEAEGIAIGETVTVSRHFSGPIGGPFGMGTILRCVAHEHHGKVIIVQVEGKPS